MYWFPQHHWLSWGLYDCSCLSVPYGNPCDIRVKDHLIVMVQLLHRLSGIYMYKCLSYGHLIWSCDLPSDMHLMTSWAQRSWAADTSGNACVLLCHRFWMKMESTLRHKACSFRSPPWSMLAWVHTGLLMPILTVVIKFKHNRLCTDIC